MKVSKREDLILVDETLEQKGITLFVLMQKGLLSDKAALAALSAIKKQITERIKRTKETKSDCDYCI